MAGTKAVIFDIGNVLVPDSMPSIIMEALRVYSKRMRPKNMLMEIAKQRFKFSKLFYESIEQLQRREIGELEFWHKVLGIPRGSSTLEEARGVFSRPFKRNFRIYRPALALVGELRRAGYKVVALTNTIQSHFQVTNRLLGPHFDAIIASCNERLSKPQRGIYLRAAEAAGARPEECIFIDDRQRYVDGAKGTGMKAVRYSGTAKLRKALLREGIAVHAKPRTKRGIIARAARFLPKRLGRRA